MITDVTLQTLVNKKQYETAFGLLSSKGEIKYDSKYTDGGQRVRVLGGRYHKFNWAATMINGIVTALELNHV